MSPWHVHHKNGKFNIWSTIVNAYILTEWVDEEIIIGAWIEADTKRAIENAKHNIERSKEFICSAHKPFRCEEV